MASPRTHALLIGVEDCAPSRSFGALPPPRLFGCSRDVRAAERFARGRLSVAERDLELLTAPAAGGPLPTCKEIVAAWHRLRDRAAAGDEALIFFSGHGARVRTRSPELKGQAGIDEALVPYDGSLSERRYLRDVEIYALLEELVDHGVFATVVLDCCYAGGASRLPVRIKGFEGVEEEAETGSLVAKPEALAAAWRALRSQDRGLEPESTWRAQPHGYVLLAACRANEKALEAELEDGFPRGVFSHALFRELEEATAEWSYRRLFERAVGRVRARFEEQCPAIEGDADRALFASRLLPAQPGVAVLTGDRDRHRVLLACGRAEGIGGGARFSLHRAGEPAVTLGEAEVEEPGATTSWARWTGGTEAAEPLRPGDRALLCDPGGQSLRRPVLVVGAAEQAPWAEALTSAIEQHGRGFLERVPRLASQGFALELDTAGAWRILDASEALLTTFPATLEDPRRACEAAVERLVHLARYRNLLELANRDLRCPLRDKLGLGLAKIEGDPATGRRRRFKPHELPAALAVGQWLELTISNRFARDLHVTVLDLSPRWGIRQVHPADRGGDAELLGAGGDFRLRLQASLPHGLDCGRDVLKVFFTGQPASLRWLELPKLGEGGGPERDARRPRHALEALWASLASSPPPGGFLRSSSRLAELWWVEEVEIRVAREL